MSSHAIIQLLLVRNNLSFNVENHMPRLVATVTTEIEEAVQQEHEQTGVPISTIVRNALKLYLKEKGTEVKSEVQWGGKREKQPA